MYTQTFELGWQAPPNGAKVVSEAWRDGDGNACDAFAHGTRCVAVTITVRVLWTCGRPADQGGRAAGLGWAAGPGAAPPHALS